ncbi:hypothetical protein HNQ64_000524 [Prosthecobacter dejongeii]|uniref:Uncharacterized protein n=1 Tax=Prosthecobacter dejongeii TaxID=48465 RepID=A0A7W8DNN7_9BACT|nr:hypothetical protein [Prosthecobacter dejongeii]
MISSRSVFNFELSKAHSLSPQELGGDAKVRGWSQPAEPRSQKVPYSSKRHLHALCTVPPPSPRVLKII